MYSPETSEIAKPSELLNSVKAYMNVLQCVENYVNIDITRVFNNVLLQVSCYIDCNSAINLLNLSSSANSTGGLCRRADHCISLHSVVSMQELLLHHSLHC